ncbi:MAG: hypothetical protein Q9160_009231, partial [Pyrenula sp. 1 TL-2023]
MLAEARRFAVKANQRLSDSNDQNTNFNLELLFKGAKEDAREDAKDYFAGVPPSGSGIANWRELRADVAPTDPNFAQQQKENQEKSNIRIYCDNDATSTDGTKRWTLNRDLKPDEKGYDANMPKQIDRPQRPWGPAGNGPGPQPPGFIIWGVTHRGEEEIENLKLPGQPDTRSTVVLNDVIPPGGEKAYTWKEVVSLDADASEENVNNFAFLALLASLQDLGWKVAPDIRPD